MGVRTGPPTDRIVKIQQQRSVTLHAIMDILHAIMDILHETMATLHDMMGPTRHMLVVAEKIDVGMLCPAAILYVERRQSEIVMYVQEVQCHVESRVTCLQIGHCSVGFEAGQESFLLINRAGPKGKEHGMPWKSTQ